MTIDIDEAIRIGAEAQGDSYLAWCAFKDYAYLNWTTIITELQESRTMCNKFKELANDLNKTSSPAYRGTAADILNILENNQ